MPRKIAQWLTVLLGALIVAGAPAQVVKVPGLSY